MSNKVSLQVKVQSHEVDCASSIKPFYLQCILQEAAYAGSSFCGAGYDALRPLGLAWVLNRLHIHVQALPEWGDSLQVETWSRAHVGPLWHRNFRLSRGGAVLAEATSAWTVLDLANRSIFRGQPPFRADSHCEEDTLPFCSKLVVPEGVALEPVGSHTPLFSEIDTNSHVNNCFYTQWAFDALPMDYLTGHSVKDIEINYFAEVGPGMKVDFKLGRSGDVWYFCGVSSEIVRFLIRMEF